MEIAQYLMDDAARILKFEGTEGLPKKLAGTDFYLALPRDKSVLAHGVINYRDKAYKIGPKVCAEQ